jgi:hypothetical protein
MARRAGGARALAWVHAHYAQLAAASVAASALLSVFLYAFSFRAADGARGGRAPLLAAGGRSGNAAYDF